MDDVTSSDSVAAAAERLDRALARLTNSVSVLGEGARAVSTVSREREQLAAERGRLAGELENATHRAERLDKSAAEVSRRLVDAMESVKSVLVK